MEKPIVPLRDAELKTKPGAPAKLRVQTRQDPERPVLSVRLDFPRAAYMATLPDQEGAMVVSDGTDRVVVGDHEFSLN